MYNYQTDEMKTIFREILRSGLTESGWNWLDKEAENLNRNEIRSFGAAFVMAPRKTGKNRIDIPAEQVRSVSGVRGGLKIEGWTQDRLARTFLLMNFPHEPAQTYVDVIESLFLSAEMNELVALYGALPLLAYPDQWRKRCSEGIRSNIGQVLEAVMCDNPYPSEQLDEPAWNQLVLKAIFTEKPLLKIVGLRDRANPNLARAISDFAHERWAAHRTVSPLVWVCVERHVDNHIFDDIRRLAYSPESIEQKAAALICDASQWPPAKLLLQDNARLREILEEGTTWESLSTELETSRV